MTHLPIESAELELRSIEIAAVGGSRVHDSVVSSIAAKILGGTIKPGEMLPKEDELCALLGVSRTSVREAVKVLSAKGLVESKRRVGVRVKPKEDWRILDSTVLKWHPDIRSDRELISGILEARRIFEPAAAELAARRGSPDEHAKIWNAFWAIKSAIPHDLEMVCKADLTFHRILISASHNVVLQGLVGMLEEALSASFLITNQLMDAQSRAIDAHRLVIEAISARDTAGARSAMNRLLDIAADDLHIL